MKQPGNLVIAFLLSVCSLGCFESFAQKHQNESSPYQYRAVHWGIEEKLPGNYSAIGMIKDANGSLWIGTSGGGVVRFDGSLFKDYRFEIGKKNGISVDDIRGFIEDSLHNIWIGAENGLSLYDINADTFRTVVALAKKLPSDRAIVPFWATKEEVFCWDYRDSNLVAFNIHTLSKRPLAKISPDDYSRDWFQDRFSVFDARSNSIWIVKDSGASSTGGLLQVSLSTGKKVPFTWDCYRNILKHNHSFQCMKYDRWRNAIWINSPDGLVEFTLDDKKFHHIAAMDSLLQQKNFQQKPGIDIDTLGRIWMATFPKGIIIYDPASQSLSLPFPNDSSLQQKISANNWMIYCDRDGMVWSGSYTSKSGFYQLVPFSPPVHQYISEPGKSNSLSNDFTVFCLYAGQGKVWIGTSEGLNIFDSETGHFQVLRKNDLPGLQGEIHVIQPMFIDTSAQKAWIVAGNTYDTSLRYYQMNLRSKQCIPVIFKDSNNQKLDIWGGFPRTFKNVAVLSIGYGKQTLVFIGNSDSPVAKEILSFPAGTVNDYIIATDDDHLLFFKHGNSTLSNLSYSLVHGEWIRAHTPMDSIQWENIIFNKTDQTYWLNKKDSLLHLSRDYHLIRSYSVKDGLPVGDRNWVIPDNSGNTWFNTDNSIYRLDIESGRISVLSERDGFQDNGFYPGLMPCKSASGDLYFPCGGGGKGFLRISPDKYINSASIVYIKSLLVNQQPYRFSPGIKKEPEIFLSHFENRFTIYPGIIDFNSQGKNQFRYKLGESAEWIYPENNIIYYDNLAPDNYELIMQASNANVFNGPATILHIHISPPWWQTWWARSLFALAFIFLLWGFIQWRSRNLRQRNIQLEEKVSLRTKELNHSLEELKETQTQLIQREKMASLGELTAGIAHEIQNPLNFVNNFSEVNGELIDEMDEAFNQGNMAGARSIADNIKKNIEKVIHHGKRADGIVKGMLQHSRTSTGEKIPTDFNALADEYLRLSFQGIRARDRSFNSIIQTQFDENIGKINIIPQDIGRVMLNLYNNAFYSVTEKKKKNENGLPAFAKAPAGRPAGESAAYEPIVFVSTKKLPDKVEIRVRDNGMGIPQNIIDKIYQPFFTTKPTGEGTGLGLSLSYDIITKMHGGELTVDTKVGEYAEFIIRLPIQ